MDDRTSDSIYFDYGVLTNVLHYITYQLFLNFAYRAFLPLDEVVDSRAYLPSHPGGTQENPNGTPVRGPGEFSIVIVHLIIVLTVNTEYLILKSVYTQYTSSSSV